VYPGSIGEFGYISATNEYTLGIIGTPIGIILACTGIQSIAIFVAALIVTKSDRSMWEPWSKRFLKKEMPPEVSGSGLRSWLWKRKKKRVQKVLNMTDRGRFGRAFLITIPVIYILNIFRNALIMWGTVNSVLGPNTFTIAHHYLSKIMSLGVLIVLLFLIFELLPECLEGVMGIMDLPKRTKCGMVKDGFIEFDEPDKTDEKSDKQEDIEEPKPKIPSKKLKPEKKRRKKE
jgi:exosortase/archaeosortase family protein